MSISPEKDNVAAESLVREAGLIVDCVIDLSFKTLENLAALDKDDTLKDTFVSKSQMVTCSETKTIFEDYEIDNIQWMSIDEFSIEFAEKKIVEFLKTWDYQDSWLYCVDYIGEKEHEFDIRYNYRVRWSIPTRRRPIPRATACVYFTFCVSKIKPKDYPVDVYYVFEGNRLVHKPGKSRFREKWLKDIIESKVLMMRDIDF